MYPRPEQLAKYHSMHMHIVNLKNILWIVVTTQKQIGLENFFHMQQLYYNEDRLGTKPNKR